MGQFSRVGGPKSFLHRAKALSLDWPVGWGPSPCHTHLGPSQRLHPCSKKWEEVMRKPEGEQGLFPPKLG